LQIDAEHYLGEHDTEVIYSWTPREFKNFIKGAKLRIIDSYELCAVQAIFTGKVKNTRKKSLKLKDIYDADKARKEIDNSVGVKEQPLHLERYKKAKEAMKKYSASTKK